jgi:hypothetical protein
MPDAYERLMNGLQPEDSPRVIAAICPKMVDEKRREQLIRVLTMLKRKYELYFFILGNKGDDPTETISEEEIHPFDKYAKAVKVYRLAGATPEQRSRALERFIGQHL